MIDCTKAENFLRERFRMCDSNACRDCGLSSDNNGKNLGCGVICAKHPQEAISIVQKWSDKHPHKTMLDDFKEKYPNAPINKYGVPMTCPCNLGYVKSTACPKGANGINLFCVDCWNRPYEECKK